MHPENNHRILELFRLYIRNGLTVSEKQELKAWREAAPENDNLFRHLMSERHFKDGIRRFVKYPEEEEKEWRSIRARTVRHRRWLSFGKYVALFVVSVGIGGILYRVHDKEGERIKTEYAGHAPRSLKPVLVLTDGEEISLDETLSGHRLNAVAYTLGDTLRYCSGKATGEQSEEFHLLKIPRGGEYVLILADGTRVYLNSGSSLSYPVRFADKVRRVQLEGEAYFEVTPDPDRPFVVESRGNRVEVLGTSFGMRAYTDEENVLTTLVCGRVKVATKDACVILQPGEQAVYDCKEKKVAVKTVDTELFVGWKDGRLIFDNQPLEKILRELSRWYLFEVTYENRAVVNVPFSVNIKKSENINQVLELLEKTTRVKFKTEKNMIIVK